MPDLYADNFKFRWQATLMGPVSFRPYASIALLTVLPERHTVFWWNLLFIYICPCGLSFGSSTYCLYNQDIPSKYKFERTDLLEYPWDRMVSVFDHRER